MVTILFGTNDATLDISNAKYVSSDDYSLNLKV